MPLRRQLCLCRRLGLREADICCSAVLKHATGEKDVVEDNLRRGAGDD
jgi:hypothetical protein